MAGEAKLPASIAAIDAEMAKAQERLSALAEARKRALEEQRDLGRPVLLAALEKVKIAELSRGEAKAIAKAFEIHGPARIAQHLGAI